MTPRAVLVVAGMLLAASAAAAQRAPSAVLGHMRVGLDSATWHDVQRSPFLRGQFASWQETLRQADGARVMRTVLIGRRQWLELSDGDASGSIVLGLSTEEARHAPSLVAAWRRGGVAFDSTTVFRVVRDSVQPWYLRWRVPSEAGVMLSVELTAFHPAHFARLSRRDSLPLDYTDRARALSLDYLPGRIFSELTGATFAIPLAEIRLLRETLRAGGGEIADEGEGIVVLLGDGVRLRFIPAWERPGVRRLEFYLTDAVPANPTYRFGPQSRLQFGPGRIAVWDFDLP